MPISFQQKSKLRTTSSDWQIHKLSSTASNVMLEMNKIHMSWPKISTTIYPGKSIRINTGWSTAAIPANMTMTTMPHKALLDNNLVSIPQVIDSSNKGQQMIQQVLNNNEYPVRVEYAVQENGDESFQLLKMSTNGLLSEQVLQFDWGSLLTGVAQVAAQVIPALI